MSLDQSLTTTLMLTAALCSVLAPTTAAQTTTQEPRIIQASSSSPEPNAQLSALVTEVRKQADAFVFLSGGASKMERDDQRQLLAMFGALSLVRKPGRDRGRRRRHEGGHHGSGRARAAGERPCVSVDWRRPAARSRRVARLPSIPITPIRRRRQSGGACPGPGAPRPTPCTGSLPSWRKAVRRSRSSPTAAASP